MKELSQGPPRRGFGQEQMSSDAFLVSLERAMLTSGGHISSSHLPAGLLNRLKAGMVGSFPYPDTFSVF